MDNTTKKINNLIREIMFHLDKIPVVGVTNAKRLAIISGNLELISELLEDGAQGCDKEDSNDTDSKENTGKSL